MTENTKSPLTNVVVFLLGVGAVALVGLYLTVLGDPAKPGFVAGCVFGSAGAAAWLTAHGYDFMDRRVRPLFTPTGAGKLIQLGAIAALAAALLIVS